MSNKFFRQGHLCFLQEDFFMKKRLLKTLVMVMVLTLTVLALNINASAAYTTITETREAIFYSGEMSKPKISKVAVLNSATPTLKVSWGKVNYANKYYIYRRDNSTSKYKLIAKTSKLYYKDTKVLTDTTYYYKVKACIVSEGKIKNSSDLSSSVSKAIVKVNKAENLKASAISESKVNISWDKVSGATRYYMYYSTSEKGTYKSLGYTTKNKYTVSKLNPSTTYYFMVKSAKVLDGKVYKASQSLVKSAKTKSKNGEFIVDFEKITNKEAGLPSGSAITCATMLLKYYDVECTVEDVLSYVTCTMPKKKNGEIWVESSDIMFVGNPKSASSKEKYGYGCLYQDISTLIKWYMLYTGQPNKCETEAYGIYSDEPDSIKEYILEGNIIMVRIDTDLNDKKCFVCKSKEDYGNYEREYKISEKYFIICGYNKDSIICYDPDDNKYVYFSDDNTGEIIKAFLPYRRKLS